MTSATTINQPQPGSFGPVIAMSVEADRQRLTGSMHLTVEVSDLAQLGRSLDRLLQLPNVLEAKRQR